MTIARDYFELKAEIRKLETKAKELRAILIEDVQARKSNAFRVQVVERERKVLRKDLLPESILKNPDYWEVKTSTYVTVVENTETDSLAERQSHSAEEDDIDVIESFS
ncbi:MAG: hypothetical protein ACPGNV_07860 [Mangrovicoccus sp.]